MRIIEHSRVQQAIILRRILYLLYGIPLASNAQPIERRLCFQKEVQFYNQFEIRISNVRKSNIKLERSTQQKNLLHFFCTSDTIHYIRGKRRVQGNDEL